MGCKINNLLILYKLIIIILIITTLFIKEFLPVEILYPFYNIFSTGFKYVRQYVQFLRCEYVNKIEQLAF